MSLIRVLAPAVLVAALAACDRREPAPVVYDTAAVDTPSVAVEPATPPPAPNTGWRAAEAGRLLVVPAGSALRAQLVFPQFTDTTLTAATAFELAPVEGDTVELFGPAGLVGTATLTSATPPVPRTRGTGNGAASDAACTGWPQAALVPTAEPVSPWRVAFAAGRARPLPLDSVSALAGPDSARLAADVARIASAVPQDAASPFRGLPFVVREARRFTPVAGTQAVVADVVRRLNLEASQEMEHLLLVAERSAGRPDAPWTLAYVERTAGQEETLEMSDVLAAVTLGPTRRPTLVIWRDYGDGSAYALVERGTAGRWRLRWSSAYAGC